MKAVFKFFIYLGLIAVVLYTSGCFYNHKPAPGVNSENQYTGVTAPEQPAVLEQKNTDQDYVKLNNSTNNNVQPGIKEKTCIVLYFDNGKGGLSAERREIPKVPGIARQTVYELCRGPLNHALFPTLPKNTKLLDINIKGGLCTVNFSRELITGHSGGSGAENLTVYSIVNTLTQFSSVERVQILVEDKKVKTIAGHLDVSSPLVRNDELICSI